MSHGRLLILVILALSACSKNTAPSAPAASSTTDTAATTAPAQTNSPDGSTQLATEADGVHIEYQVYGRGEPAVVLIHGWANNANYWNAQLEPLKARYTVVTLNLAGLIIAVVTGKWVMKQIYLQAYFPVCAVVLLLGLFGWLPRVGRSTKGEGIERRYFYGAVWAAVISQTVLLILWKTLPRSPATDQLKLAAFVLCLCGVGAAAAFGMLPRTRPIVPGQLMVAD